MDSNVDENVEEMESEHLLSGEKRKEDDQDRCKEEIEPLLHSHQDSDEIHHSSETCSTVVQAASVQSTSKNTISGSSGETSVPKKDHTHHYQFRRKFNFRSDSVFSDVLPSSSSQEYQKSSEEQGKSGSLNSLKPKESKWLSLRKKLGKINSSTTSSKDKDKNKTTLEQKQSGKSGNIYEKRSLLQRAKTLSILPVNRGFKEREDPAPKKQIRQPPELFNVGGEMNMIPLELLININDLHISK